MRCGYMLKELLSVKVRRSLSVSSLGKHSQQISSSVLQVERYQADFAGQEINGVGGLCCFALLEQNSSAWKNKLSQFPFSVLKLCLPFSS